MERGREREREGGGGGEGGRRERERGKDVLTDRTLSMYDMVAYVS